MKIHNEQLRALREAETRHARKPDEGEAFGALFTRQLDSEQIRDAAPEYAATPTPGLLSLRFAGIEDNSASSADSLKKEAAGRMEDMLGTFERYAGELARDDKADLRRAYSLLEGMNSSISGFASRFPDIRATQPKLAAIFNELDVLVSAETFKFNRGDYL
ncbi:MAG: hypothetical protein LBD42_02755 [Desulfovibrio sp.]|jgi:hypothetical protein|nr:hypothetical protein [Desulfovibrio sp.]